MEKRTIEAFTLEIINASTMQVTWTGEATGAAVNAMRDYATACEEEFGVGVIRNLFVDATEGTGLNREGRKAFNQIGHDKPWERVAFVGVRFEIKVMVELITKAITLMKMDTAELKFAKTKAEALTWFDC